MPKTKKKKTPSTPIYLRPVKGPLTDAQRLVRLEALVIDLADALGAVVAHSSCAHERWTLLMYQHKPVVSAVWSAAVVARIRRDKGKCDFCGRDANKCYWRHAEGKSCA